MAWARFTDAFDWPKLSPAHVAYKEGMRCNVSRACLAAAVAAGAAVAIKTPARAHVAELKKNPRWTPPPPKGRRSS